MKKKLIVLFSFCFSFNALSSEFLNNKEYTTRYEQTTKIPKIMEFFSFFCPYCYEFEKNHDIHNLLKKNTTNNIKIKTYHVNFLGGKLSYMLSKAWVIAQKMNIEEKIMLPIFKGVQDTHTIYNAVSIKKIFINQGGINSDLYNKFWNSLTVEMIVQNNNKKIQKANIDHVPTMLINGKYVIDYNRLETYFKNDFLKKYIDLVVFLSNKK